MTRHSILQHLFTPAALGSLLASSLITPSHAVLSSYTNAGNGVWGVGLNWSNGVPDEVGDIAFVGTSVNAENSKVNLNKNIALDGLLITDGMHVNTNGYSLGIWEPIPAAGLKIIGTNMIGETPRHSRLIIPPIAAQGNFLTTVPFKDASLEDGGQIVMEGGGLWCTGSLDIDAESALIGSGVVVFNSHDHFNNNGTIAAEVNGELSINAIHDDFYLNLDGTNRTGTLSAMSVNSKITLDYDPSFVIFDGNLEIGPGSQIDFEHDLLFGIGGAGNLNMSSTFFQTAILKVGEDHKVVVGSGSEINTTGNCLIDGAFHMAGTETALNVNAGNASRLTIDGNARFLGGTVTAAGHLLLKEGVSESTNTTFILDGGEIEAKDGTMINLKGPDANDYLKGHGLWSAGVNNETRIQANGGTLTVDSTNSPTNWDGVNEEGRLDARDGSLHLIQPFGIATFNSYAIVGNGHTLTLDAPAWDFTSESEIVLGGDIDQGGIITATGNLDVKGKVTVSMPSNFASSTTFHSTAKIGLENTELLLSGGQFEIKQGASLQGDGILKVAHGSTLNFGLLNQIETGLTNEGSLTVNSTSSGILTIDGPFLPAGDSGIGRVIIDIKSRPVGNNYDRIQANNTVDLAGGILRVNFDVMDAQLGDVWKVISADNISGVFSNFSFNGTPNGMGLRTLIAEDGVYLKLVPKSLSYLEWANQQGLLLADLAMDSDPDGDDIDNIAEMYYGGNPLQADHDLKPAVGLETIDGKTYLILTVLQAVHAQIGNGIFMQVQESFGLENWANAQAVLMSTLYDPEHCRNILTYRSKTPITDHQKQFLRAAFFSL